MDPNAILKEGVIYKKRTWLKTWKPKYLVLTRTKLLYFDHFKTQQPKRVQDIDLYKPSRISQTKKKFTFTFNHKIHSKKSLVLGVRSREQAQQWVQCFNFEESPEQKTYEPQPIKHKTQSSSLKLQEKETGKIESFNNSQQWKLIGDMKWVSESLYKYITFIQSSPEIIIEGIQSQRVQWDWIVSQSRLVTSYSTYKIYQMTVNQKPACVISYYCPDTQILVLKTIDHIYYKSSLSFVQYFLISQHPFISNLSQVTMITDLPIFQRSFQTLKKYLLCKQFKGLEEMPAARNEHMFQQNTGPYSFDQFFIYGPGGRYQRNQIRGGLLFQDQETLAKQKKVMSYMLKNIGRNILQGKSVMNISLPVNVFQTVTILQRTFMMFGYAPIFIKKAAQAENPLQRFKQILTFCISCLHLTTEQKKPFNPILGQTCQGMIGTTQCFAQQTSHHPPISHFLMIDENFQIDGYHQYMASTSLNSVKARQKGLTRLRFGQQEVFISFPQVVISGTMYGKRMFDWAGVLTVMDPKNRLFCQLIFNPGKKGFNKNKTLTDYFQGNIVSVSDQHIMMTKEGREAIEEDGKKSLQNSDHIQQELCRVVGNWPTNIQIDKVNYWEFDSYRPFRLVPSLDRLHSDSTYRLDLKALINSTEEQAQKYKEELENVQRRDRKLRGDNH